MKNNHINQSGDLHMIDISEKEITLRTARAIGEIVLNDQAFDSIIQLTNKKGDVLKRHKDRPSCQISTTLHLGGNEWPIYIDPTGSDNVIDEYKEIHKPNAPQGNRVDLKIGDMLVYSGCELEHWREAFEGNVCVQTFLHYNDADGRFGKENIFDKRPMLGIPK